MLFKKNKKSLVTLAKYSQKAKENFESLPKPTDLMSAKSISLIRTLMSKKLTKSQIKIVDTMISKVAKGKTLKEQEYKKLSALQTQVKQSRKRSKNYEELFR